MATYLNIYHTFFLQEGNMIGGAFRFALVHAAVCPSVGKFFNFVTKLEKWGHACPMGTFLVQPLNCLISQFLYVHRLNIYVTNTEAIICTVKPVNRTTLGRDRTRLNGQVVYWDILLSYLINKRLRKGGLYLQGGLY